MWGMTGDRLWMGGYKLTVFANFYCKDSFLFINIYEEDHSNTKEGVTN